jgi:hypothetical protein
MMMENKLDKHFQMVSSHHLYHQGAFFVVLLPLYTVILGENTELFPFGAS